MRNQTVYCMYFLSFFINLEQEVPSTWEIKYDTHLVVVSACISEAPHTFKTAKMLLWAKLLEEDERLYCKAVICNK